MTAEEVSSHVSSALLTGLVELNLRPTINAKPVGLADVVALARELGAAHLFGLDVDVVDGEAPEVRELEAPTSPEVLGVPVRQRPHRLPHTLTTPPKTGGRLPFWDSYPERSSTRWRPGDAS